VVETRVFEVGDLCSWLSAEGLTERPASRSHRPSIMIDDGNKKTFWVLALVSGVLLAASGMGEVQLGWGGLVR
jgi:hypothetical protein